MKLVIPSLMESVRPVQMDQPTVVLTLKKRTFAVLTPPLLEMVGVMIIEPTPLFYPFLLIFFIDLSIYHSDFYW